LLRLLRQRMAAVRHRITMVWLSFCRLEKGPAMRMTDQEYFRSCIAKERHLAQLLGHQHIEECYESAGTLWDNNQALPQWTRDWRACGPLMAAHGISVSFEPGDSSQVRIGATVVHFADHPTPDRAVMFGMVKELIFLLEHGKPVKLVQAA
jgi:sugar phosphate isomerase/epimerase